MADLEVFPPGKFLEGKARDDFTQFGEDGLIEATFERYGVVNRRCFEVGAADGIFFSNTLRLRNAGWSAVLIEADFKNFEKLKENSKNNEICIHEKIDADSLDRILTNSGCPVNLDFGVIDIDGQDYWIWKGLKWFRPRVVLIEFQPTPERFIPIVGGSGQATLAPMMELAEEKGYVVLAKTYVNILCVERDVYLHPGEK